MTDRKDSISGRRILVVEDDFLIVLDLIDHLEALGAVVVGPFHDVPTALVALPGETIDAAVLDVKVGRMTVFPVADALAERGVPFMFATGFDAKIIPERFAGRRRLTKPVSRRDLATALAGILAA